MVFESTTTEGIKSEITEFIHQWFNSRYPKNAIMMGPVFMPEFEQEWVKPMKIQFMKYDTIQGKNVVDREEWIETPHDRILRLIEEKIISFVVINNLGD